MSGYPWLNLSIEELWSWRGQILVKQGFKLPDPSVFSKEGEKHPIFDPYVITVARKYSANDDPPTITYYRHGKQISPDSKWVKRYLRDTPQDAL